MPSLDATITAYVDTLPVLNTLRLCQRFGKRPHCVVNKLPVELMQQIENYVIDDVRAEKRERWAASLRCFEDECDLLDPFERADLLEVWWSNKRWCEGDKDPDDEDLLSDMSYHELEFENLIGQEHLCHHANKDEWHSTIKDFIETQREFLEDNFGLDIWFSHVPVKRKNTRFGTPETIVAYLTMPDRVEESRR